MTGPSGGTFVLFPIVTSSVPLTSWPLFVTSIVTGIHCWALTNPMYPTLTVIDTGFAAAWAATEAARENNAVTNRATATRAEARRRLAGIYTSNTARSLNSNGVLNGQSPIGLRSSTFRVWQRANSTVGGPLLEDARGWEGC